MDRNASNDLDGKPDFLKHVLNFDDTGKSEMLNMLQYSVLSIVPIVCLNKIIQKFIPEADDAKGSFELLAELLAQMFTMFLGIILINRIVTYLPTYSGVKYMEINLVNIVLGFLMIVFSLQTKLGEKVNIILARVLELWDGTPSQKHPPSKGNTGAVRVTQPISPPLHQPSQSDNLSSSAIGLLPQGQPGMSSSMQQNIPSQQPQQNDTNFQQMYSGPNNPLQDAASPQTEPMAANEAFAGSPFAGLF